MMRGVQPFRHGGGKPEGKEGGYNTPKSGNAPLLNFIPYVH